MTYANATQQPPQSITALRAAVLLALTIVASPGRAQTTAPPPAAAPASAPTAAEAKRAEAAERITVTATRRREPVREVPVQVNTIDAEQLEREGARSLTDYLANQPGINVETTGGAGRGAVTIRGVSNGDQASATVGTYVDDVAFGSSSSFLVGGGTALDLTMLDLRRIEVLRGPQGTLYGAGSMGGLLKYVTNEPDTYTLAGRVTLGGSKTESGGNGYTLGAMVNVPLSQGVAGLRVVAMEDKDGGYVDAVGPAAGKDVNGGKTRGARASLLLLPAPGLSVRFSATGQEIKRDGVDTIDYTLAGQLVEGELVQRIAQREPYKIKIELASAEIQYDLKWARFDSITSWQYLRLDARSDLTSTYGPLLVAALGQPAYAAIPLDASAFTRKKTQEFRLTSQTRGAIEWLAGLYYTNEEGTNRQRLYGTMPDGDPDLFGATIPSNYTETAVYGNVTWNLSPALALTGGARVFKNRQTFQQDLAGPLAGGVSSLTNTSKETSQTYLLAANYKLTDVSNVYLRAASGYRPGGPNLVARDPITGEFLAPPMVGHDSLWSYEAGYKADLLDKTLSVEAAVYQIRWKDMQTPAAVNGVNVLVNAGKAKINGAEFSASWRPTQSLTLGTSLAYIDGKLTEDAPTLGVAGERLPNSPRFAATASVNYDFAIGGRASYVGANYRHVGQRNANFESNTSHYKLPAYDMVDLQAGIEFKPLRLSLYLRNAFNETAQLGATTAGIAVPLSTEAVGVTQARPRTLGFVLEASF